MLTVSDLYKAIWSDQTHIVQTKVTIAGKDYLDGDIAGLSITGSMFAGNGPSIGGAVCREIDLELQTDGADIPRSAEIKIYIRLALLDSTGAVASASEWISKGVFYIDIRELDASGEWLSMHGYDAMLKGEQPLLDQKNGETDLWPQSMSAVASACAEKIGVEIDVRTSISSTYTIGYPADYTCRELLQHIAVAHCGNWIITDAGKLRLVTIGSVDGDNAIQLGTAMMDFTSSPAFQPYSRVTLWVDDNNCYTAGGDTGRTMEADCPWATQEICDAVLAMVNGYQYVPYTATDAMLDPAAEIGDSVSVNGRYSVLASIEATFDSMFAATVAAPADEELDHEFPYKSSTIRRFDRKLAQTKSEIMVKLDSITLKVTGADGTVSEVKLTDKGQIDLTGYATFLGLSDGTTVIDGGCIKAGSKIESPIIEGGEIYGGRYYAGTADDAEGYAEMGADGFGVYSDDGNPKLTLGYTRIDYDYPYLELGSGSGASGSRGLVKKFRDGLWIGNSAPKEDGGDFEPQSGYIGLFFRFTNNTAYVVSGTNMQNIYTGDAVARFG